MNSILICLCTLAIVLMGRFMFNNIDIFEFDTAYAANIIQGLLIDGIPSLNSINSTSVVTCISNGTLVCGDHSVIANPNVEIVPIEHTSGYLLIYFSAFFYRVIGFFVLNEAGSDRIAFFNTIIASYVLYVSLIEASCVIVLYRLLKYSGVTMDKTRQYGYLLVIVYILTPLLLKDILMNRIIGELPAILYGLCAYLVAVFITFAFCVYNRLGGRNNNDNSVMLRFLIASNCLIGVMLVLACEAKSAFLPYSLVVIAYALTISLIFIKTIAARDITVGLKSTAKHTVRVIIAVLIVSIGLCLISNKAIAIINLLITRRDLIFEYLDGVHDFIKFQANAGRNWGGDSSLTGISNLVSLLGNYNFSGLSLLSIVAVILVFDVVAISIVLIMIFAMENRYRSFLQRIAMVLVGNLAIVASSFLYPLVYKFPYPRIVGLGVSVCLQQVLLIGVLMHLHLKTLPNDGRVLGIIE